MAQDFAKKRQPPPSGGKPARASRPSAPVSRLNWFISGFLVGVIGVVGGYVGLTQYQASHQQALDARVAKNTPDKQPTFDFGFYRELANTEVKVPPGANTTTPAAGSPTPSAQQPTPVAGTTGKPVSAPATTASAEPVQNFLLQAGSFQDKQEADERRVKITLMNMPSEIVPGVVAGRTWYRVQVGPFAGRAATDEARKQLSASNIDSIPLLMR